MDAATLMPLMTRVPTENRQQKADFIVKNWGIPVFRNLLLAAAGLTKDQIVQLGKSDD